MRYLAAVLLLFLQPFGSATLAQVQPRPGTGDPRLQLIDYRRDQVVRIAAAPGFLVTVELAPDEQIQTVAVGDSAAWQVSASRGGNLLFIKALQSGADTNMTVVTSARFYAFDLAAESGGVAYQVRFMYPPSDALNGDLPAPGPAAMTGLYQTRGARALRPERISDDGNKTYIQWAPDVALPAVFFLDSDGRETLANGYMRNGIFVLDSIFDRLLFRIDRQTARAERLPPDVPSK